MSRRSSPLHAIALFAFASMVFVGACSDPPTRPAPAGEGSAKPPLPIGGSSDAGRDSGNADGGGDAGTCNDLVTTGSLIDRIGIVGDPPVSNGGVVADGTYELTVYSVYVGPGGLGGPTGITAKSNLRISGGKVDEVLEVGGSGKATSTTRSNSAYAITAASFATTELCPRTGGGKARQFTANDTTLTLTDLTTKEAFTFVKR